MASLLLRLFNSDYFSPHLALSYLSTYADYIGITYYLITKLASDFPPDDVEFYWPQYCHLLVTRPSESRALESFLLRRCEEDVHLALITLWYVQAQLADLAHDPTAPAFRTCQRVYNRCQRILFEDPDPAARPPRPALLRFLPLFDARRRVSPHHVRSCLVGMGASLAGLACPAFATYAGGMALQQGRRAQDADADDAEAPAAGAAPLDAAPAAPPAPPEAAEPPAPAAPAAPPADPGEEAFGQDEEAQAAMRLTHHASASVPSLAAPPRAPRAVASSSDVATPASAAADAAASCTYAAQQQYLRSHYGRTETQFLQSLQDIAARLQALPKLARLSALRAELTALNHTLPSEVCFPTWCHGTAADHAGRAERHHRVVRISASEAVVLNSADRVPYLLHVEVLRNDLDFDPARRANRELLGRLLGRAPDAPPPPPPAAPGPAPARAAPPARASPPPGARAEEMDLTEQMYGADLAAFGVERDAERDGLGETNQSLDAAAWASAAQAPASRADVTLEEYAQRMRTAAVMLAQLNSRTATEQPIMTHTPATPAPQGWASWIVGTPAPEADGAAPAGAKVLSADTHTIRQRIMDEMAALEEQRMARMKQGGAFFARHRPNQLAAEDETAVLRAVNKDDPSAAYFRESWTAKCARIRASSPYGHLPQWDLFSVIVKTGADLRQEQFAVQLIREFQRVWADGGSRCWVHYFRIVVLNEDAGLIETIRDAVSVHSIKKDAYARQLGGQAMATYTLYDHFVQTYGEPHTPRFRAARRAFTESLAGYAIVTYLLQIKDRHNGNILVDAAGHLIHIDFGFMLGISPGGVGFEAAPFKLPKDYIEILGGMDSDGFRAFQQLMRQGFRDVRKHAERFIMLVELMQKDSKLPCFALGDLATANLRDRFQLTLTAAQCDEFVDRLILSSAGSAFTRLYDQYQNFTQNIL
ncbi:1-phosphatidylinositol 4-kinase [Malassezia brasiliensis]|uniref:1-phosphatidylinositol 4-kinase n=1 Tax=Malassezia brasiliensis TaxID=1821822 RepID=A0AAF0DVD7_9BASI|nr:1-phosphatidylinositol 4-kinase [Malassezia brasiliensis]